jgi:hemerythrin-like domain-containing protein
MKWPALQTSVFLIAIKSAAPLAKNRRFHMSPPLPAPTPAADFEHPLDMLAACHDRIEDRCDLLHRIKDYLRDHGTDEQIRQASTNVLRYFDTAGEHHHQDEEIDLFPLLVPADPASSELVQQLCDEHRQMRAAWQELRAPLLRLAGGEAAALDAALVDRFTTLYRRHIETEESRLLPLASRVLDAATLRRLGARMAQRRGVKP